MVSSAEIIGAFNTGFDRIDLHRPARMVRPSHSQPFSRAHRRISRCPPSQEGH